ncbi:MAG: nucleotide-binding protein [Gallionellaceae bacterium]|nr:nucleotide-binding protein [Gallionellaceae bacterium]
MKALLAICSLVVATHAWAGDPPAAAASGTVTGEVLEFKDVDGYTYLRLKTGDGETWAAVNKTTVKPGAAVTLENVLVMTNFESKSLKQVFPTILFATLGGPEASAVTSSADMVAAHASVAKAEVGVDTPVEKASGINAYTVAETIGKSAELKDKPVLVRGKVVKYNPMILGKNWIHLRDGSGSAADNTNDLLVTSTNSVKLGDVVTVNGVVHVNRDFGAGYVYKVLIEEATVNP